MKKRNLFSEIAEGFDALKAQREGKVTLRSYSLEAKVPPRITGKDVLELRERMKLSRAVFAAYLRTNIRTIENWEQGRAHPNAQAAVLIKLVEKHPETVQYLEAL